MLKHARARAIAALLGACAAEIRALKPGNVSFHSPGHGMRAEDFVASAKAIAKPLTAPGLCVGERVYRAIEATRRTVSFNTNLGIVLLCAPLVHAAIEPIQGSDLRARVKRVLAELDHGDAEWAFKAIALAEPGGLGRKTRHDVRGPAGVTLLQAMEEAAGWDRIAYEYSHNFDGIFDFGVARMREGLARYGSEEWAAVWTYLGFLSRFPDTHIVRKWGEDAANRVCVECRRFVRRMHASVNPGTLLPSLREWDSRLKAEGINPGTTADLTVASLLASRLEDLFTEDFTGRDERNAPGRSKKWGRTHGLVH